jgi:hypothetical protein
MWGALFGVRVASAGMVKFTLLQAALEELVGGAQDIE